MGEGRGEGAVSLILIANSNEESNSSQANEALHFRRGPPSNNGRRDLRSLHPRRRPFPATLNNGTRSAEFEDGGLACLTDLATGHSLRLRRFGVTTPALRTGLPTPALPFHRASWRNSPNGIKLVHLHECSAGRRTRQARAPTTARDGACAPQLNGMDSAQDLIGRQESAAGGGPVSFSPAWKTGVIASSHAVPPVGASPAYRASEPTKSARWQISR